MRTNKEESARAINIRGMNVWRGNHPTTVSGSIVMVVGRSEPQEKDESGGDNGRKRDRAADIGYGLPLLPFSRSSRNKRRFFRVLSFHNYEPLPSARKQASELGFIPTPLRHRFRLS